MDPKLGVLVIDELLTQIDELKVAAKAAATARAHPIVPGAKVYGMTVSANAMSAILFSKHILGDACEFEICNLMEREQLQPDFLAMNAFHTIPTFKDANGFALGESNAILRYIANKYAPEYYGLGSLETRAKIDWALDLRSMKLYSDHYNGDFANIVYPVMGFAPAPADQNATNKCCTQNLEIFSETFLQGQKFVGGAAPCIADFALAPIIFALSHSKIKEHTGFELPTVWKDFVADFVVAVPVSSLLSDAGGYSIAEFLNSK